MDIETIMMERDPSEFGDYEGYEETDEEMDEEMEIQEQLIDGTDASNDFFDELERYYYISNGL